MRAVWAFCFAAVLATASFAHQLNVFAFVEDGTVVVETKFSTGKIPISGEVRVLNAASEVVATLMLAADGTVRLPLDAAFAETGLTIEVTTGEGHSDYWILTPQDIANGTGS